MKPFILKTLFGDFPPFSGVAFFTFWLPVLGISAIFLSLAHAARLIELWQPRNIWQWEENGLIMYLFGLGLCLPRIAFDIYTGMLDARDWVRSRL